MLLTLSLIHIWIQAARDGPYVGRGDEVLIENRAAGNVRLHSRNPYRRVGRGVYADIRKRNGVVGTGDGGKNYTGSMSSAVTVTPCDG